MFKITVGLMIMRGLFYLVLLLILITAMTTGIKVCFNGQCQEFKIEAYK